ncbi:hypothetical protein VNO77_21837 [Canavalia gladiata]|uniref:Enoyl reductase (ER) domain-containing protein n=1 Tax=Canavalia gladiata TaxID=3824 RepID=A0AAN9L1P3_CANGL
MEVTNTYIVIKQYIEGELGVSNFEFKTEALVLSVEPGSDNIIVQNLYLSVDPYQINRMKSQSPSQNSVNATVRINPGEAFDAPAIGKVVASGNSKFEKDDLVLGKFTWAGRKLQRFVGSAEQLEKVKMEVPNKYVVIKHHIEGSPKESHFELKTEPFALSIEPGSDDIIVQNLYISVDPYQINRMKSQSPSQNSIRFAGRINPGEVFDAPGIGKVVASGNAKFQKGDLVMGNLTWAEYSLVKEGNIVNKIESSEFPLSYHIGVLGMSGMSAYAGFFEVCKPQKGEKVFVSAASGSVGNLVGQYAKILGCYVIGCAGSQKKVALLKEKLGFDDAFNYKEEADLNSTLKRYFPDGIDIYFDNVGGEMLEAAVANMKAFGRVVVCGVISEYTDAGKRASPNMLDVVYKRITIRGFLVSDFMTCFADFFAKSLDYLRADKLKVIEDISSGVESIPSAFVALFNGDNIGKKIVKLVEGEHSEEKDE